MCLEGFQCGLSWLTVLRKREHFRHAFADFDIEAVARFDARDLRRLLADANIVRHRGKVESTINNARQTLKLIDETGSSASFVWRFEPQNASRPKRFDYATLNVITQTPESRALSKALKRRGFTFVGPTTIYALMQAMGLVNDHLAGCSIRDICENERHAFQRP